MALSISVAWYVILTEILIWTECAPKLGHAMFDPLAFEAAQFKDIDDDIDEDFLSNDSPTLSLEDKSTLTTNTETTLFLLKNNSPNEYATTTTTKQKRMTHEFANTPKKTSSARPKSTIIVSRTWKPNIDPIKRKADDTTNNEKSFTKSKKYKFLRRDNKCEGTNKTCNASGYDFDPTNCKTIDDRILCGYDKNIGTPKSNDVPISIENNTGNMGNDCRIRGDRIECGYVKAPFTGIRRPSFLRSRSKLKFEILDKKYDTLQTSTKQIKDIAAMTETTTETTEFITEIITSTSITSQITSPETTTAASQRNDYETFTTSSINIEANTPSSAPSSTTANITSENTPTKTTLAALRKNSNESTTGKTSNNASSDTLSSTSPSTSGIDIDTYIPSTISSSTTSSEMNTESTVTEKPTEKVMKCFEKDDRIVCYDLYI